MPALAPGGNMEFENTGTYGQKLAKELEGKFKLSNNVTELLASQIDKAITDAIKADTYLRLLAKERIIRRQETPEKREERIKKMLATKERIKNGETELDELNSLRRELADALSGSFDGRVVTNDTKEKIKRLKELEKKYKYNVK